MGYLLNGGHKIADASAYAEALKELAGCSLQISCVDAPVSNENILVHAEEEKLDSARPAPHLKNISNWWIASYSAIQFQSEDIEHVNEPESFPDRDTATARDEQMEEESRVAPELIGQQVEQSLGAVSAVNVMHHFPAGAIWGTLLHSVLEWAAVQEYIDAHGHKMKGFAAVCIENTTSCDKFLAFCKRRRVEKYHAPLWGWLVNFVQQSWQLDALAEGAQFSLSDLKPTQIAVELEFMLESHRVNATALDKVVRAHTLNQASRPVAKTNVLNGLLKGFIDLVAEHNGRYYVIDWKSNRLGKNDADYTQEAMLKQILAHRYDMQYVLYLVALHRQLKARLPDYDYDVHVGGAIYVFLRGMNANLAEGLFCDKPPKALIEELDALLKGAKR